MVNVKFFLRGWLDLVQFPIYENFQLLFAGFVPAQLYNRFQRSFLVLCIQSKDSQYRASGLG